MTEREDLTKKRKYLCLFCICKKPHLFQLFLRSFNSHMTLILYSSACQMSIINNVWHQSSSLWNLNIFNGFSIKVKCVASEENSHNEIFVKFRETTIFPYFPYYWWDVPLLRLLYAKSISAWSNQGSVMCLLSILNQ